MDLLKIALLFAVTAVAEIVGCYLPWLVVKQDKSAWLLLPAALSLALFAWLLTLHPTAAGRTYAAYGGMYIAVALVWLHFVDGVALDELSQQPQALRDHAADEGQHQAEGDDGDQLGGMRHGCRLSCSVARARHPSRTGRRHAPRTTARRGRRTDARRDEALCGKVLPPADRSPERRRDAGLGRDAQMREEGQGLQVFRTALMTPACVSAPREPFPVRFRPSAARIFTRRQPGFPELTLP